jgi:hypothetical protein
VASALNNIEVHFLQTMNEFELISEQTSLPGGRGRLGPDLRDQPHHRHELPELRLHGLVQEPHQRRRPVSGQKTWRTLQGTIDIQSQ